MAKALKGFLLYPPQDTRKQMRTVVNKYLSSHITVCDWDDLRLLGADFIVRRNLLIPHFMLSKRYSEIFDTPYQDVCKSMLGDSTRRNYDRLLALGMLGNALPEEERMKLGDFISEYLKAEQRTPLKRAAFKALAFLFHQQGIESVLGSVRGEKNEYIVSLAYKTALLIAYKNERNVDDVAARFLYDDYPAETKIAAASLLYSMDTPKSINSLLYWMKDVELTMKGMEREAVLIAIARTDGKDYSANNRQAVAAAAEVVKTNVAQMAMQIGMGADREAYNQVVTTFMGGRVLLPYNA